MEDQYECFALVWAGRSVGVRYQANWLNSGHWHIELRCTERLPVTDTGYRSIFVPATGLAGEADIRAFVTELLDEAATDKNWLRYLEERRQLKLF